MSNPQIIELTYDAIVLLLQEKGLLPEGAKIVSSDKPGHPATRSIYLTAEHESFQYTNIDGAFNTQLITTLEVEFANQEKNNE